MERPEEHSRPVLVIAGASGVVGTHLIHHALGRYDIRILTRRSNVQTPSGVTPVVWSPTAAKEGDEGALQRTSEALSGAAALVNLAGASIADGRLGEEHKRRVLESRVDSTMTLLEAHKRSAAPPSTWVQGSATGYYGDAGERELTEDAPPAEDFFLADVCKLWEAATGDANGARIIISRTGLVLAKDAPAWQKMLLPIKLFAGGRLGDGEQWYPWIDADDLANAMLFLIGNSGSRGPYNLTAPEPVRQIELAERAARRLGRPAIFPTPAFMLRLALGGVADALLLPSARAVPKKLEAEGFVFERAQVDAELDKLLG